MKYTVCAALLLCLPIQPVDVTITQKLFRGVPVDGPALELCASGGNSESDSQMLM